MKLAFYCEFYNDIERLKRAVTSLRAVYPTEELVLLSDGSTRIEEARKFFDKTISSGRLIVPEAGYSLWSRRASIWAHMDFTHLICFDTDTLFHRPFICEFDEAKPFVYGRCWVTDDGRLGVKGGCYGLTRAAVVNIINNLDIPSLPPVSTFIRPGYETPSLRIDLTAIEVYRQCNVRKRECCDFGVDFSTPPAGNFAVTHPHKDVDAE